MKYLPRTSPWLYFQLVRKRHAICAFLIALFALGMQGIVLATSMSSVQLVSVNREGTDSGNSRSTFESSISADARFVAFVSEADNLVTTDTNGQGDVFVRDLNSGYTSLVSVNKEGNDSGSSGSSSPTISASGRYVVFSSRSDDLVEADENGEWDVFVRDLQNGTTTLVSVNKDGTNSGAGNSGHCDCGNLAISADGRFVVFYSLANDLVATDTNDKVDVFVRDLQMGTTRLVSVNADGTDSGTGHSFFLSISADGRFVAFNSYADNLVATDTNGREDIFVRDLQSETTTLVSVNIDGSDSGSSYSYSPVISKDGRFVAFVSWADNLVATDTNGLADIFVRDLQSETTTLVSVNIDGSDSGSSDSYSPVISKDGRFVAFTSYADNLVTTDTNGTQDAFVRDLKKGTTTLVSLNKDGTNSGSGYSVNLSLSADGRFVTFESYADDLVDTDTNGMKDVFVRDLQRGTTTLISINTDETDSGNGESVAPIISENGRIVVFLSDANDLVSTDTNGVQDVFAYEVDNETQGCNCADPDAIVGTSGPDFLYGTEQADIICGLEGQDFIAGQGGEDCIDGGEGNDWIFGGNADDVIFGRGGEDIIYGQRGNDLINGDEDDDYLFGNSGDDKLNGGVGYDWIFCGLGTDIGRGEYVRECEN